MTADGARNVLAEVAAEVMVWLRAIDLADTHEALDQVGRELVEAGHDTLVLRAAGRERRAQLGPRPRPLPERRPGEDAVTARDREHGRRVVERRSARSAQRSRPH